MKIAKFPLLLSALFVLASCDAAIYEGSSLAPSSSNSETTTYQIFFDLKGGTSSSSISPKSVKSLSSSDFFFDCVRTGYSFRGWSYNNSKVFDEKGKQVSTPTLASSMVFTADWEAISYSITYELNGGTNVLANPSTYTIEDDLTLENPTKEGYTFAGWYSDSSFTSLSLDFSGDKTFYAKWSIMSYPISYELNGGTNSPYNPSFFTIEEEITLGDPSRAGYSFAGWYSEASFETKVTSIPRGTTSSIKLYAKWDLVTYSITYELNGGTNNGSNPDSYNTEIAITLSNPTRKGYTFAGWYFDSSFREGTYGIPLGSSGDKTLYAKWSPIKNGINVSVTCSTGAEGDIWVRNSDGYTDTEAQVGAVVADSNSAFKGWYANGKFLSRSAIYKFTMPANDVSLEAVFWTKEEETAWKKTVGAIPTLSSNGKNITYGLYPKTHVSDAVTLASLNNLTVTDTNGYYRFNDVYYARCFGKSAATGSITYVFDDGSAIKNDEIYWFKCEPIVWNILQSSDNTYSLVSSLLLDTKRFDRASSLYDDSEIRKWLIGDFYNSAFALDDASLNQVTVDNTGKTRYTNTILDGDGSTEDKVYLLSYQDYIDSSLGFNSDKHTYDPARYTLTTDWARANGCYYRYDDDYNKCGCYWTRSSGNGRDVASYVDDCGWLNINDSVTRSTYCVRPAINVTLASE